MGGGLLAGLSNIDAARYAFLLATPIIGAAAVLKLPDLLGHDGNGVRGQALVASLCSAVTAYLAVRFLMRFFETNRLTPFAVFCLDRGLRLLRLFRFVISGISESGNFGGDRLGTIRRARRSAAAPPGSPPRSPPSGRARASRSRPRARSSPATRRRRRAGSRRRSATTTRPSSTPRTSGARSHETADRRLVEVLTGEAPSAIHWLEELGVEFTREQRRLPARALRRRARASGCCRSATAPGTRSPTALRDARRGGRRRRRSRTRRCRRSSRATAAGARAAATQRARGGHGRPRRRRPLLRGGRGARRALDEPSGRDRRGDAASRSTSAPRRATSTRSSTTRTAAPGRRTCRATRSPRRRAPTAPCSLNADGEEFTDSLGPRDVVSQAIVDEVEKGKGVDDARRAPGGLPRHDADRARPTPRSRSRTCSAATAPPASTRSPSRSSPTRCSTTRTAAS